MSSSSYFSLDFTMELSHALSELDTLNFDKKDDQRQSIRASYDGNDIFV